MTVSQVQAELRSHLRPEYVDAIIDELLVGQLQLSGARDLRYPGIGGPGGNLVMLTAPTQNGKTQEMLAMAWVGFFKHGLASYVFLRSDATAYSDIKMSVSSLNEKIMAFCMAKRASGWRGFCPSDYQLSISVLQDKRAVSREDLYNDPNDAWRTLKPIVRCRVLTAMNVKNAQGERELGPMVEAFGVTEDRRRLNLMVFIDESQNTRLSLDGSRTMLEKNLFGSSANMGRCMRAAAQRFAAEYGIDAGLLINPRRTPPLRELAALYVEVTATPEPTFIVEADSAAQLIKCRIDDDYYGYAEEVRSG